MTISILLLLLFVVSLSLPCGIVLNFKSEQKLIWFLLWGIPVSYSRFRFFRKRSSEEVQRKRKWFSFLSLKTIEDFPIYLITVRRFLHCIHYRIRKAEVILAAPDPYVTGTIYGYSCAIEGINSRPFPIRFIPDFTASKPSISGRIIVYVFPGQVLFEACRTGFHFLLKRMKH